MKSRRCGLARATQILDSTTARLPAAGEGLHCQRKSVKTAAVAILQRTEYASAKTMGFDRVEMELE